MPEPKEWTPEPGQTHIPPELWGRDHFTTLLYLETRCVDHRGYVDDRQMRGRDPKYPAILRDGLVASMHSDYDCVSDMIAEGLAGHASGDGSRERYFLTDKGWQEAWALRKDRAERALREET